MTSQEIREQFLTLEGLIADGCSTVNLKESPPSLEDLSCAGQRDALDTWTHRITGLDCEELLSHVIYSEIPVFELVRSFVAAGLCRLVFESSFPDFIDTESPLLDQYRRHILIKGKT
jgi:hypothetical protein